MLPEGRVIGVVHLLPLPGSPGYRGDLARVLERARLDARAYDEGGVDALIVENYGDAPFLKGRLPAETVAALTRGALAVREACDLPLGINALRNDAHAALAVAVAVEAHFVRINVHAGVAATDQGIIEGEAAQTLRLREILCARISTRISILADVHVKHARPLDQPDIVLAACDLLQRAGADGVILTGAATGAAASRIELAALRAALPSSYIAVGSGTTVATVAETLSLANAVIVGTSLKKSGKTTAAVDPARVRAFVKAAREAKPRGKRSK